MRTQSVRIRLHPSRPDGNVTLSSLGHRYGQLVLCMVKQADDGTAGPTIRWPVLGGVMHNYGVV